MYIHVLSFKGNGSPLNRPWVLFMIRNIATKYSQLNVQFTRSDNNTTAITLLLHHYLHLRTSPDHSPPPPRPTSPS